MAKDKFKILVIHGPNLDRLGKREKNVYGEMTLEELNAEIAAVAGKLGVNVETFQSNKEGELVAKINTAGEAFDFLVVNPGAYTHVSYAIHDAIRAADLPAIEVHLSNVGAREPFRRVSVVAPACIGSIAGFGAFSYLMALEMAMSMLEADTDSEAAGRE
ncbi:MAG: type II 3-dehydroquinate dehydratase [Candidatus Lindowbacteria bacterium RIFCSPLOWO2_12_FULL_62_27]|nr:MAG: type II 3-dehydroquinate dehydratase [Candidatus Lindowbacteria bacterium RIFCSPLOWO2_12_FULL_62_27]OGH61703.1 MAG: type II 3-dehydroquinate dehydratase [Candidatus Lindowbacteria bacterium RIFCSPLOWO2_02_FULL_62_12]